MTEGAVTNAGAPVGLPAGAFLCSRERRLTAQDLAVVADLQRLLESLGAGEATGPHDLGGRSVAEEMLAVAVALALAPFDRDEVVAVRRLRDVTFLRAIRGDDTVRARMSIRTVRPLGGGMHLSDVDVVLADRQDRTLVQMRLDAVCRPAGSVRRRDEQAALADEAFDIDLWGEAVAG